MPQTKKMPPDFSQVLRKWKQKIALCHSGGPQPLETVVKLTKLGHRAAGGQSLPFLNSEHGNTLTAAKSNPGSHQLKGVNVNTYVNVSHVP